MPASIPLTLALLGVSALGPGLIVVRGLRWSALERLAAAVGVSLLVVYLASFALFVSHSDPRWAWGLSLLALAALGGSAGVLRRLAASRRVRRTAIAALCIAIWVLALLAIVRSYSGGGWSGDWVEHYERSLFFLERKDPATRFIGDYGLTARPPMMNVLAAHILAQSGSDFYLFQVVFAALNSLSFLPCTLLLTPLGARRHRAVVTLGCLLALSPMFVENATYSWTKQLSAFYVLLGTALYLRGRDRVSPSRRVAAFVALAAGCLVHYSAVPYALVLGVHYLVGSLRAPRRRREAAATCLLAGLIVASWVGWAATTLGARATFAANPTVEDSAGLSALQFLARAAGNVATTVVPHPLRRDRTAEFFGAGGSLGSTRDYFFLLYQSSFPAALGCAGLIAVTAIAWRAGAGRRRHLAPRSLRAERVRRDSRFWLGYAVPSALLGIATFHMDESFGVAQIVLQPLVLAGLALAAARLPALPAGVRFAAVAGAAADAALGIGLQFAAQSADYSPFVTTLPSPQRREVGMALLGSAVPHNAAMKLHHGYVFLGDLAAGAQPALFLALALGCGAILATLFASLSGANRPGRL